MDGEPVPSVLIVCTANRCRSVMTQALLTLRLGAAAQVRSAGLLERGLPPPPETVAAMAGYGLDVAGYRSRTVTGGELRSADLVLAMAREHVRHAAVTEPSVWPRAFTLKELLRRGGQIGRREPGESLAGWLARVHVGREHGALLGDSPEDDVADPAGGPPQAHVLTAAELDRLLSELVSLCWERLTSDNSRRP
jgi:low molecular weight protein-tyrosine phosphatase